MSAKKLVAFFLSFFLSSLSASAADHEEWSKFVHSFGYFAYPHRKHFVDLLYNVLNQSDIQLDNQCRHHVRMYADQLDNATYGAMTMFDSFSNPKPGIESFLVYDMGHYETCEKARLDGLPGKFYLLKVRYPLPSTSECIELYDRSLVNSSWVLKQAKKFIPGMLTPLLMGICIPSTCTIDDLNSTVSSKFLKEHYPVTFEVEKPYTNDSPSYSLVKLVARWLLLAIIFVNIFSTIVNFDKNSLLGQFNLKRNWRVLFRRPHNPSTQFIAEWKVRYSLFATVVHLFIPVTGGETYYQIGIPFYTALDETDYLRYAIIAFPTLVGFNFIISGSLSVFMWRSYKKEQKVNFIQFILVRVLRSLPVMIFILFFILILPDFQLKGPEMELFTANVSGNCFENGLSDIFFYSNYIPVPVMCFKTGWFVSADMQLYILSFFLLMYLCNTQVSYDSARKVLRWVIAFATVTSCSMAYYYFPQMHDVLANRSEFFLDNPWRLVKMYLDTPQYILPYAIGMFLGYEMANGTQWPAAKASFICKILILMNAASIYIPYSLDLASYSRELFTAVITIQRIIFMMSAAAYFYGSWSQQDLSKTKITPIGYMCTVFSRFQYPWFLIHPLVTSYMVIWLGYSYTSYMKILAVILPGEMVITLFLSLLFHLMVETPFANLFGSLMKKQPPQATQVPLSEGKSNVNYDKDKKN